MNRLRYVSTLLLATNAMAFALQILGFMLILVLLGDSKADAVWTVPGCLLAWGVAIPVCWKYLDK
jgi:hypothetical protein